MKKRIDLGWRVAVAVLLLVLAVAPAALLGGSIAALEPGDPPGTYLDPIPDFINEDYADEHPWITGTSIAAPYRDIDDVWVQIINESNDYRWRETAGGSWIYDVNLWNDATVAALYWGDRQWDWEYDNINAPIGADFYHCTSYTVKVRAEDDDGYMDLSPESDTFTYDDKDPDVSFTTVFDPVMYQDDLLGIEGDAHDDCSPIAQVRMRIQRLGPVRFWNGYFWSTDGAWVPVQVSGTGTDVTWHIDQTTYPPLPEWENDERYIIEIQSQDAAGNTRIETSITFRYRHKLTSAGVYIDPLPQFAGPDTYFIDRGEFTGTTRTENPQLQDITRIRLKIYDHTDELYWDDTATAWTGSDPSWADCVEEVTPPANPNLVDNVVPYGQWDWTIDVPGTLVWLDGHEYRVQAQMVDDQGPPPPSAVANTYTSSWETFIYDDNEPGSNIDPYDVITYDHWTYLTGESFDAGLAGFEGDVAAVMVSIERTFTPYDWWDGNTWGRCEWGAVAPAPCVDNWWNYIWATPQDGNFNSDDEDWVVNLDTTPGLPPLRNAEDYTVYVRTMDAAGNLESTSTKTFTFKYDMAEAHPTPLPEYDAGPTSTPEGTSTPEATSTPETTATPEPTAKPTKTPAKATPTPEATATPEPTPTPAPTPTEEDEGWPWWYWLLIGLGALLIIGLIVLLLLKSRGGEGEGEGMGEEEGYEEEEL
jgi:hypothetical protein